jgi:hypothetical protein
MVTNAEAISRIITNGNLKNNVEYNNNNFYTISVKLNGFSVYGTEYAKIRENRTEGIKFFIRMALLMFGIRPTDVRFSERFVHFDYYNNEPAKYE